VGYRVCGASGKECDYRRTGDSGEEIRKTDNDPEGKRELDVSSADTAR